MQSVFAFPGEFNMGSIFGFGSDALRQRMFGGAGAAMPGSFVFGADRLGRSGWAASCVLDIERAVAKNGGFLRFLLTSTASVDRRGVDQSKGMADFRASDCPCPLIANCQNGGASTDRHPLPRRLQTATGTPPVPLSIARTSPMPVARATRRVSEKSLTRDISPLMADHSIAKCANFKTGDRVGVRVSRNARHSRLSDTAFDQPGAGRGDFNGRFQDRQCLPRGVECARLGTEALHVKRA